MGIRLHGKNNVFVMLRFGIAFFAICKTYFTIYKAYIEFINFQIVPLRNSDIAPG